MDLPFTLGLLGLSLALGFVGLLGVRVPPQPGQWRGWIPSHYLLLTGLAGILCFGLHALALVK